MRSFVVFLAVGLSCAPTAGSAGGPGAPFTYIAPSGVFSYDPTTGFSVLELEFAIHEADGAGRNTQAFSMRCGHDPAVLQCLALSAAPALGAIEADVFAAQIQPHGWGVGVLYSFGVDVFLVFPVPTPVVRVQYATQPSTLFGDIDGASSLLRLDQPVGQPLVENVVVVDGFPIYPQLEHGTVNLVPGAFLRGDCNSDDIVNVADAIWNIQQLFLAGPISTCMEACDINDDELHDASDSVYLIYYQFLFGPPPPAPFEDCGTDFPTLNCAAWSCV